jgi:hypothetical protein
MHGRRAGLLVLALLTLALGLGSCRPPPDPDALPPAAIPLGFGRTHVDALDCKRNDCTDWFRVRVPDNGDLDIELRPAENAPEATSVSTTLVDASGRQLERESAARNAAGQVELRLEAPVTPGTYLFAVAAPGTRKRIDYRLSVAFRAAPPPPRPSKRPTFKTLSTRVLEVEGKRSVLLEAGARTGIRSGQNGKLIDGDRVIGEIIVIEVYNDGSRARIDGGLSGSITPRTRAEIQVPQVPQ